MDKLGALVFTFFILTLTLPAQEDRLPYYFQLNGNLQLSIPLEAFGEVTSPTTLLLPQLGVTFQFSSRDFKEEAPEDY